LAVAAEVALEMATVVLEMRQVPLVEVVAEEMLVVQALVVMAITVVQVLGNKAVVAVVEKMPLV
jgi:hypothetical protein